VKKFSKITESKEFLGYSKEKLKSEFDTHLSSRETGIDLIYVSKGRDGTDVFNDVDEFEESDKDNLFSPMFLINLNLGEIPPSNTHHEINGIHPGNWVDESIKFDLIRNEFDKLSSFLKEYEDDFFISVEVNGSASRSWSFAKAKDAMLMVNRIAGKYLISISLSLIMKDSFEYDQIIES
jgi:hypothetical protein